MWGEKKTRLRAARAILAVTGIVAMIFAAGFSASARASTHQKHGKKGKARPAAQPLCQVNNITVEMPKEFLPLRVLSNSFVARENSAAVLTLRDGFPQTIQEFAAVLEYLDDNGKRIFAVVFAASANPQNSQAWFSENLPSQYSIAPWKEAMAAGATFTMGATSGLTTATCPAQARATLVHAAFANGKALDWSAPDWQLPAQLAEIPGNLALDAPPAASLPEKFLVRVRVLAPVGSVIPNSQIQLLRGKSGRFFDDLRGQMQEWRYWFALRGGKRADGDALLLIRVHSADEGEGAEQNIFRVTPEDVPEALGIVDIAPRKTPGQWTVSYGGAPIGNHLLAQTPQ